MYKIRIATQFGLEALTRWQLERMGYQDLTVENGAVSLLGGIRDISRLNLHLSTADRVSIVMGDFTARTFEELFDQIYDLAWEELLPEEANFLVQGKSYESQLFSVRNVQSITEKAIVKKLQTRYPVAWFNKQGARYQVQVALRQDRVLVTVDTSGSGLHKRGYRQESGRAPLRENLAAALVELSFYEASRPFYDLFCGSGTIAIEAARRARQMAPGLDRDFDFTAWSPAFEEAHRLERQAALAQIDYERPLRIFASDVAGGIIEEAIKNADRAGVREDINFVTRDFRSVQIKNDYGILISNLPYGERIQEKKEVDKILADLGPKLAKLDHFSHYLLSNDRGLEKKLGRRASRRRKLFNGPIETTYYQYYGPRPPKEEADED